MDHLLKKYEKKLAAQGICDEGSPLLGSIDAEIEWNRKSGNVEILNRVIEGLNINSILYAKPAEPYDSIINYLSAEALQGGSSIQCEDSETRTFLHDIPVAENFYPETIIHNLKQRKALIIKNHGIVTFGTVSPEQAFITYSSVCFSCYVKFFVDYYYKREASKNQIISATLQNYKNHMDQISGFPEMKGPFIKKADVIEAMAEAGKLTVESRMVDSFFGNISYKTDDTIFISRTGSSLDELSGNIDACPTDGSSTAAITASSEFAAHESIYEQTGSKAILHGHPKFCVIMSMLCDEECANRGRCHRDCGKKRFINDIPIVPGEVGTGPTGLCHTLPQAMHGRGAVVFGHGLFTTGKVDFTEAFKNLVDIEAMCLKEYKKAIES